MRAWLKLTIAAAALVLAVVVYVAVFHFGGSPVVTIENRSAENLRSVSIAGSGFSEHFDVIPPHSTVSRVVKVGGESGLEIRFTANAHEFRKSDLAYIESSWGYVAHITVDEKLQISCDTKVNGYK